MYQENKYLTSNGIPRYLEFIAVFVNDIIMLNIKIVHITEALYYGMPYQFLIDCLNLTDFKNSLRRVYLKYNSKIF